MLALKVTFVLTVTFALGFYAGCRASATALQRMARRSGEERAVLHMLRDHQRSKTGATRSP